MSRNDGALYSGGSSAAERKLKLLREDTRDKKDQQRSQLAPAAEIVRAELKKDMEMTGDLLLDLVAGDKTLSHGLSVTDDQAAKLLMAVRLHRKWIADFTTRINNQLRIPKTTEKSGQNATFGESDE
jgi:hypothetical protein